MNGFLEKRKDECWFDYEHRFSEAEKATIAKTPNRSDLPDYTDGNLRTKRYAWSKRASADGLVRMAVPAIAALISALWPARYN